MKSWMIDSLSELTEVMAGGNWKDGCLEGGIQLGGEG